ncbi:MAG: NUDIX domain-containing protein [Candidatus Woesearchaeota archaeon]
MELLHEIKDTYSQKGLFEREASRAVLFDKGLVPLLFVSKFNYYKIPGGGIDPGEDRKKALIREVQEETGCKIKLTGEVGKIIECRAEHNLN